ncbi:hypothetical protein EJ04DRAFT_310925 [Polyplosphaeria fusca]|uniref:DUF7580 domain-containing protein n=1 Tax=Polyplosphaeria fusca TaxID=682080 RepID=A0A9P4V4C9_9PLEO|nr:hypothetical protein EJ04DRAFT_310925 [Polyplosphaeria fusca]
MSGFEIAGVVLGSLPLVISALEHYSEGLSTLQRMVRYEAVFQQLHVIFESGWTTYMASCERLLMPLAISDADFKELLQSPTSDKWKDILLNQKLKARLGSTYMPYKVATKELHRKVEKLRKKLKLSETYLPPWVTAVDGQQIIDNAERSKFFKSKWIRIKGGIDSQGCTKLVDLIMRDIELISTMVKDAAELEAPRKRRQEQQNVSYWITIRDHARRIHNTFAACWSQPCRCQHSHRANLRLDVRKPEPDDSPTRVRFMFSLCFDQMTGSPATVPWDWRHVEIESYWYSQTSLKLPAPATTVRFSTSTPSLNATAPAHLNRTISQPTFSAPQITDLCDTLRVPSKRPTALGYLDDQAWQHHLYSHHHTQQIVSSLRIVSLYDVISSRTRGDISTKEKRALALKLALAVLQLHDTPWLPPTWDSKNIQFITNSPNNPTSLFEPSYVACSFSAASPGQCQQQRSSNGRILSKNPMIFALGVALIELSYGMPLLQRALPSELDDQGIPNANTEMLVAARLVKDIRNRELDNYAWATARCVECDMGYPFDYSLEDDGFRAKFVEGVVLPLKDDYEEVFAEV